MVSALCFLQCFDTVDWVTESASFIRPVETCVTYVVKGSFLEQMEAGNRGGTG